MSRLSFFIAEAGTYSVSIPLTVAVLGGIVTTLLAVVGVLALVRGASIKTTLETQAASIESLATANAELRETIAAKDREHQEDRDKFRRELQDEREKRAVIEGRLEVVTSELGKSIADAVVRAVEVAIQARPVAP